MLDTRNLLINLKGEHQGESDPIKYSFGSHYLICVSESDALT